MKLSDEVMLEIVDIFRQGIAEGKDVSDLLRAIELDEDLDSPDGDHRSSKVLLSLKYKMSKGRQV